MSFSGPLPDNILRLMSPKDRPPGVAGKLKEEIADENEKKSEKRLHSDIIQYINLKGWMAFYGAMNKKAHRTLGENDFHCLLPNGRVLFVECKVGNKGLSPDQEKVKSKIAALGHTMHVIRTLKEFIELCETYDK